MQVAHPVVDFGDLGVAGNNPLQKLKGIGAAPLGLQALGHADRGPGVRGLSRQHLSPVAEGFGWLKLKTVELGKRQPQGHIVGQSGDSLLERCHGLLPLAQP